jgi:hypothetical protein
MPTRTIQYVPSRISNERRSVIDAGLEVSWEGTLTVSATGVDAFVVTLRIGGTAFETGFNEGCCRITG